MESGNFKMIYAGSVTAEAVSHLDGGDLCALIYCDSGYGVAWLNGERAELRPECAIALLSRGKSQGITLSEDFKGSFILCSGELADFLFSYYLDPQKKNKEFLLSDFSRERGRKAISTIFASDGDELYRVHTLLRMLSDPSESASGKGKPTSVSAIREYIDKNTDKKITLELLSKQFFISKTQIHRLFIAEYAISPMKYMLKRKIEVSKEMLTSTNMKISEIADKLCFTDSKHYTKTFRAFTGMLPRDYRASVKTI